MSSEIPVGSPPVPPGRHAAPSGWYPDPANAAQERYWDGWQWSRNTRPRASQPTDQRPSGQRQPSAQQQPYGQQPSGQQQPYAQQPYGQPQGGPQGWGAQPGQSGYPAGRPLVPVASTADGVPLAGWWWRVLAIVIDGLIVGVVSALLSLPIYLRLARALGDYINASLRAAEQGLPMPAQPEVNALLSSTDQVILVLVSFVVQTLYIIAFLRWRSATPGKLVVGLRVVPVDRGRSTDPLAWSAVVARALVWTVPDLQPLLIVVRAADVVWPLVNPKRQALHDLAARTQVVKIR